MLRLKHRRMYISRPKLSYRFRNTRKRRMAMMRQAMTYYANKSGKTSAVTDFYLKATVNRKTYRRFHGIK